MIRKAGAISSPVRSTNHVATSGVSPPITPKQILNPRLALALLLYTAQRRSDVIRMGRQHIRHTPEGPALYVKQCKTGAELLIPIYPELGAGRDSAKD